MKVAHVVVGGEVSGGQIICERIIEALRQRGDQALLVSPTRGGFTQHLEEAQIPVYFIPFRKTYHFQNALRFARLLKAEQVDLVHTHAMVPGNVQARLGAKLAGVPVISHIHGPNKFRDHGAIRAYQVLLDNLTSRFCSEIISVSESTKEALVRQGIPRDRIRVIYNGISVHRCVISKTRESIMKELGIEPNRRLVGMVGALSPMKGQNDFILAARDVVAQIPEAVFIVVGKDIETKGAYEAALKQLVLRFGLDSKIIFTGYRGDVLDVMHAFDLFVLPSKVEGLPLTILEAMALKKAVIAFRVGGIPEIVRDGETGILVPLNDIESLAQAIVALLRDPSKAARMGESGHKRIEHRFSEERMIHQIMEIYDRILKQTGGNKKAFIHSRREPIRTHVMT